MLCTPAPWQYLNLTQLALDPWQQLANLQEATSEVLYSPFVHTDGRHSVHLR